MSINVLAIRSGANVTRGKDVCNAMGIAAIKALYEPHCDDLHQGLRAIVSEFLLDWHVITPHTAEPCSPLTNHKAECMPRRWVIARQLRHGTRSPSSSRFQRVGQRHRHLLML